MCYGLMSVCLSVCHKSVFYQRLNTFSRNIAQYPSVATLVSDTKRMGLTQWGAKYTWKNLQHCSFATLQLSMLKMAELMVMPFGLRAQTGPRSHKLDGSRSPWEGQF